MYPPILDLGTIDGPLTITGAGGPIDFRPFYVDHGKTQALGFRFHDIAYVPDVSDLPPEAWEAVAGLDTWILDALRYTPHPTHAHLALSLDWIARAAPGTPCSPICTMISTMRRCSANCRPASHRRMMA